MPRREAVGRGVAGAGEVPVFPRGCQRDAIPLRVLGALAPTEDSRHACRKVRRRRLAADHVDSWVADVATTLNSLGGFSKEECSRSNSAKKPILHDVALTHVRRSVQTWGKPPVDLSCRGAFRELQASHSYGGDPVHVAPLDLKLLSLVGAGDPRPLDQLLEGGCDEVRQFCDEFCLPNGLAEGRFGKERKPKCHLDPSLRQPRVYEELVRAMLEKKMIEPCLDIKEECCIFAVWKKPGPNGPRQRLIIDARRSNTWFSTPPKTELATGDAFSRMVAVSQDALELGQTDIQDAFYQLGLPMELRPLFGLPGARAGRVGVSVTCDGVPVAPSTLVRFRLCVVPMGWTHALHLCQRVLEGASRSVEGL